MDNIVKKAVEDGIEEYFIKSTKRKSTTTNNETKNQEDLKTGWGSC